jgi:restriction system protein
MDQRLNWRFGRQLQTRLNQPAQLSRIGWTVMGGITAVFAVWKLYRWILQPTWIVTLPSILGELIEITEIATAFTIAFLWAALLWRQRQPAHSPAVQPMNLDELYALSPRDFEKYVAHLFRRRGYRVQLRGKSGDKGVDLMLVNQVGKRAIVQCKRYRHTVGSEIVRELFGTLIHEKAAHAFLVTTASISDAARQWAKGKPITLIDGKTLVNIVTAIHANSKL